MAALLGVSGSAQARPGWALDNVTAVGQRLQAHPVDLSTSLTLAGALLEHVRIGGDAQTLDRARQLIAKALQMAPDNPTAHSLNARQLMVGHQFNEALAAAAIARAHGASDLATLAIQADALTELGRYPEAEAVVQTLLDGYSGPAAWSRAAHFRFLYGDLDGAIELVRRSLQFARLAAFDNAWLSLQLSELLLYAGDLHGAQHAAQTALQAAPIAAMAMQAKISEAQGHAEQSAALLGAALQRQLQPELVTELWRLARARSDWTEMARQRPLLEGLARLDEATGNLNRRVFAFWYAEQDGQLATAARLARAELAARPDIYSHDLVAWVLHRQGRDSEARPHAERAIALGTPDPQLRAHAAVIFRSLDDRRSDLQMKDASLGASPPATAGTVSGLSPP